MIRDVRGRPEVWGRRCASAALAGGLLTLALCAFGVLQAFAGLDVEETCTLVQHQEFDEGYWAAHVRSSLLPPYRTPCNAGYDMVPGWVNPAIAVSAACCALSVAVLLVLLGARLVRPRR